MEYRQLQNFSAYEIYADGRIIRKKWKTPKGIHLKRAELSQTIDKNGYRTVRLMNNQGHYQQFYVHRLIWTVWEGVISPGIEIDHINGLRSGKDENGIDANALSNLRAVSHKTNCRNSRSLENYRRANALSAGKFNRDKMTAAKSEENKDRLKREYMSMTVSKGKVGIYEFMKTAHCNYYTALKIKAEMEGERSANH